MMTRRAAIRLDGLGLVLVVLLGGAGGCPSQCLTPDGEVELVGIDEDPSLGTFEGTVSWLQTGEQSMLRLIITPLADVAMRKCDYATVSVSYELESADAVLVQQHTTDGWADDKGKVTHGPLWLTLDPAALIDDGKLPNAPGIGERNPSARLTLEWREGGDWTGAIEVRTAHEELTAALVTLSRTGE